jgi:hypothetical protein
VKGIVVSAGVGPPPTGMKPSGAGIGSTAACLPRESALGSDREPARVLAEPRRWDRDSGVGGSASCIGQVIRCSRFLRLP